MNRVDLATSALREDMRRRETVEQDLNWLSFHDQLTGLANRGLFYHRIGQALRSHFRGGQHFAVFFLDLDGFKQVNDDFGHGTGDRVLREIAERLRRAEAHTVRMASPARDDEAQRLAEQALIDAEMSRSAEAMWSVSGTIGRDLDRRSQALVKREAGLDARQARLDAREHLADRRDGFARLRQAQQDARDTAADQRDRYMDDRSKMLDARERDLDQPTVHQDQ